jgi:hypothetical protein
MTETGHAEERDEIAELELWWLPLGADGSPLVRATGHCYEALRARREHRRTLLLVHSALRVRRDDEPWSVVEVAPAWDRRSPTRGVVAEGPVGLRALGRSVWFRYEVRCWPGGVIPDAAHVIGAPVRIPTDLSRVANLVDLLGRVPTPTWGRDELRTGEMWNSNSVVAWLLAGSGHALPEPPTGHRAPGWTSGVEVARRASTGPTPLPEAVGSS